MIAINEENKDLDSTIDRLRRNLRVSKIVCLVLGVVIIIVLVARLFI